MSLETSLAKLADPEPFARWDAVRALGALWSQDPSRVERASREALVDPFHLARREAAGTLHAHDWVPETTRDQVLYLLAQQDWAALKRLKTGVIPVLLEFLAEPDREVARGILETLVHAGNRVPEDLPALAARYETVSEESRLRLVEVAGKIDSSEQADRLLRPLLTKALQAQEMPLRYAAAHALGLRQDIGAFPPLLAATRERHHGVGEMVGWAISQLGPGVIPACLDALEAHPGNRYLAVALARLGSAAVDHMVRRYGNPGHRPRDTPAPLRDVVFVLERTQDPRAPALLATLVEALRAGRLRPDMDAEPRSELVTRLTRAREALERGYVVSLAGD